MIDPELARRALAYRPPPRPPAPVFQQIAMATLGVQLLDTAGPAESAADELQRLSPAWIGIDTEYRAVDRPDGPALRDDWRDPSRIDPISLGLAAFVHSNIDDSLLVYRYAFDLRTAATRAAVSRALALSTVYVAHNFRAELFTLQAMGLAFPERVFCTWLAAKLCELGRHHRHYENPAPKDEFEELRAKEVAEQKRVRGVSLLGLLRRHGMPFRFGSDKGRMQRSYQSLARSTPLTNLDAAYVAADAEAAGALYPRMRAALDADGLSHHYDTIELPGARAFAATQIRGVRVDDRRRALAHCAALVAVSRAEADLEGYGFPVEDRPVRRVMVNSRPALFRALQAHNLLHLFRSSKLASGYTITRDRLSEFRDVHPLLDALYRHRRYAGVVSDRLFLGGYVGADGNVHCGIDPLGAGTGRPTYARPNLVGLSAKLRPIIVPDRPGHGLAELDFVAQEIFIAAVVFGDAVLLADVNAGDPYRRMVVALFADLPFGHEGWSDREFAGHPVCRTLRKRAKVLTLGVIYGMGDATIAAQLGVSEVRARQLRDRFFARYAGLKAGMAQAVSLLEQFGYAKTVTGARRFRGAKGLLSRWERRWAVNTPVQGSAACALKLLLARLNVILAAYGAHVLLAPYDAVLIQYPLDDRGPLALAAAANEMKAVMRELFPGCEPRVDTNTADPSCWNDEGQSDSIERFLSESEVRR